MITQKYLKECLHYCPDTGRFTWKARPLHHFSSARIMNSSNTQRSGKIAGRLNGNGYREIAINRTLYGAHRLAWLYVFGCWPKNQIDHINGDRSDNAITNIRDVTAEINAKNKIVGRRNSSGVMGVTWDKTRSKWMCRISKSGKTVNLGRFENIDDAISMRKQAESENGYHNNHGRSE